MLWWRGVRAGSARKERLRRRLAELYATLSTQQLSYDEPGMTQREDVRQGFRRTLLRERIGNGEAAFRQAYEALLQGRMHREAGLDIFPADLPLNDGADFVSYVSYGPLVVANPCRVIGVLDEPLRAGVTYGTLPGHSLCGEEELVVELESGGTVWLVAQAHSRPGRHYARLRAPLMRRAQSVITRRFARALRGLADQSPRSAP